MQEGIGRKGWPMLDQVKVMSGQQGPLALVLRGEEAEAERGRGEEAEAERGRGETL